jgi:hypothetical protein
MNLTDKIREAPESQEEKLSDIAQRSDKLTAHGPKAARIPALDFTKGALVLIMVLYHWINYFYGSQDNRYLRFLTPSFIFITGFLISNVYISKYGISDPQLPKRLIQRGLKILGVFVLLNLTRSVLSPGGSPEQSSFYSSLRSLVDVYLVGSVGGGGQAKAIAFFILVPISYLLILSALLLAVAKVYRYTFHVVCLLFLLGIVILDFKGLASPNLELLTIGLLGVIAGYAPIEQVNAIVRHPYLLGVAYLCYLGAITRWNVIYPLQIVGVYLSLMIIYLVGLSSGQPGRVRNLFVLLGKYSLFGYIAQIAILQFLRAVLSHIDSETAVRAMSFVLAFALTIISVEVVHRARAQSSTLDTVYKAVFA